MFVMSLSILWIRSISPACRKIQANPSAGLCMARMINLSNYFLTIMCTTIRNFTTLSPLFATVTAHLTVTTLNFTSWGTT